MSAPDPIARHAESAARTFARSVERTFDRAVARPVAVFLRDVGHGLAEVCHNSFALIGLAVVALAIFFASRADLRLAVELQAFGWLQARHTVAVVEDPQSPEVLSRSVADVDAVDRATALDPKDLDRRQAAVANWLSRRYRVAPEPISRLVQEAWTIGQRARIDPTLLLAIMAIESSFNPFAQSSVGAQGLMQVMTRLHDDKYVAFGGNHAAFDPVANLRVGALVLKECIVRAGSIEAGLRFYVGAANLPEDGGYAAKVLAEQSHLVSVAAGRRVAFNASNSPPPTVAVIPAPQASAPSAVEAQEEREPESDQKLALR